MDIKWTPEAVNWLQEIVAYIAKDSPKRAEGFAARLVDSVQRLREFPMSGVVLPEDQRYRALVVSGYRVLYRVRSEEVIISMILSPGLHIENALHRRWE